jgi:hypothetical protein
MAFVAPEDQLAFLGVLNSQPFDRLMALFAGKIGGVQYEAGLIRRTPVPIITPEAHSTLSALAKSGWLIQRSADMVVEVSHAFTVPALLQVEGLSFGERADAWAARMAALEAELARVQSEVDDLCYGLYGISEEDRRAIGMGFGVSIDADGVDGAGDADADEDGGAVVERDSRGLAAGLASWAVGVAVGRFDLRLATGERRAVEPDPFDPLPMCSPGMLTGADGLPLVTPSPEYAVEVSPVLVDDPGHRLDITFRVRSVFEAVFAQEADRWWGDVGIVLNAKGGEVGGWLTREFFDYHLKMYSKSRRKAPIFWPMGTKTGSYVIWLYAHQASPDSLFQILNDLVVPKLAVEERELTQLGLDAGADATASQRKAIDSRERFVAELREFREQLESVAPLWAPDLNDGTVIVLAPLWSLFAHHRAWSSELKRHWAKLAKGDYDWAQLAMRLWPERVVPKCAEDRSLAIAHGLEDVFWMKDKASEDKWLPRQPPATPVDQLVAQRHSPATTAALQRMST